MITKFVFLGVMILLSAVFSGTETALISITGSKVDELVDRKRPNSRLLKKLKRDPHKLLITVLVGNNIVNILASAYSGLLFTEIFGSKGLGIATGVMTLFILIFGEITPKSFAHQYRVAVSLLMARPIYYLQILIWPLVWFFEKIVELSHRVLGTKKVVTVTEGELLAMIKIGAQEGSIAKHEKEFIENVLEFNDIEVGEIMTARVNIVGLDSEITLSKAIKFAIKHSHSRLPVFKKNMDNIIGVLSTKDLLKFSQQYAGTKKLIDLPLSHPHEVPSSKKIYNLFKEFQTKFVHMAVVIGDFGGTAGIITLEDIIEEIVGDILDESDPKEVKMKVLDRRTIKVTGSVLMDDINDFFHFELSEDGHETVHSWLVDHVQRFPREGEVIKIDDFKITILSLQKRLVDQVLIKKIKKHGS
ncbi:DUF21 domain-containing protein [Candidatus Peregrinibacteria bacterium]|nr:DUF21 domain-containing protein [Candidatus Peregrinibacteria bacterium]